ncbi:MAG: cobalamin-independent methionine synthase II family protein [Gammaproteobacteria bacterium]|nr:cobalamin-independent methionine synthase II family protein [Gammaproteobacteria bacterium]
MPNSEQRILTTHVGSLVRPTRLREYATRIEEGELVDQNEFDSYLRQAVAQVVAEQTQVGIDVVSDGEYPHFYGWSTYVFSRLTGFVERDVTVAAGAGKDARLFPEFYAEYFPSQNIRRRGVRHVTAPITYVGQDEIRKTIAMFKQALAQNSSATGFLTAVAPCSAVPNFVNEHYASDEEALFALADALHEEYKAVTDAGLILQVDDAFIPYMWDVAFTERGIEDYRAWTQVRIDALNHALRGLPEQQLRYHICWGSFNTPHTTDVPAKEIIDLILQVNVGYYCLEMANPRHEHEWRIWENVHLPPGRTLIPGVVSHATNIVEHPELVAERIERLARLVGRDNLMAGTDCGFAQSPFTRRVHPSIQWAKLRALTEGAALASKRLWS